MSSQLLYIVIVVSFSDYCVMAKKQDQHTWSETCVTIYSLNEKPKKRRFFSECLLHLGVLPYSFCVVLCVRLFVILSWYPKTCLQHSFFEHRSNIYYFFLIFLTIKIHLFFLVLEKTTESHAIFYVESGYLTHTYNAFRPNSSTLTCMLGLCIVDPVARRTGSRYGKAIHRSICEPLLLNACSTC